MSSQPLKKIAADVSRAFTNEFAEKDRRTRDVPRLDALIAQLAPIVEELADDGGVERELLARMRAEREAILHVMRLEPARDDEIYISEPGARVNIYTKLHARAFRRDAEMIDIALLDEVLEGLQRALADLHKRTPTSPARWMVENIEIASNAVAVCRQQRRLLDETLAKPIAAVREELEGYLLDAVALADIELTSVPELVARKARANHLAATLKALTRIPNAPWSGHGDAVEQMRRLEERVRSLNGRRKQDGDGGFAQILEGELETLDALYDERRCATEAQPFSDLIERAACVGLHASDLYNRTRLQRADRLAIQSRKRLELFLQAEAALVAHRAHRQSLH